MSGPTVAEDSTTTFFGAARFFLGATIHWNLANLVNEVRAARSEQMLAQSPAAGLGEL